MTAVKRDHSTMKEIPSNAASCSSTTTTTCRQCNQFFSSRNALFRHLNVCGVKIDQDASLSISSSSTTIEERIRSTTSSKTSSCFVVVTGGRLRGQTLQSCERYDVFRSTWESFPHMLDNRGSHGAAVVNDRLYVIGGGGLKTNLSSCETITITETMMMMNNSTAKTNWEYIIAPMNTERHALSVLAHKGKIYAIGGWSHGSTCSKDMEIYDPQVHTWSIAPSMTVPRRLLATTVWKNRTLLAIGGCCADGDWNSSAVEAYDCDTNAVWVRKSDAPCSGQASATAIHNKNDDLVYVFFHGQENVYEYNPECDSWKCLATCTLPIPDWSCFEIVTLEKRFIFCLGGASRRKWLNAFWVLDSLDNTWWELPPMQRKRRRPAAALICY